MILVDTSVWVDHLRRRNARLVRLLEDAEVACHPFVVGELALGQLRNRDELIALLEELPSTRVATHAETLSVVEQRGLAGTGIGWLDAHLLASALLERCGLWTLDRPLIGAARKCGLAWRGQE